MAVWLSVLNETSMLYFLPCQAQGSQKKMRQKDCKGQNLRRAAVKNVFRHDKAVTHVNLQSCTALPGPAHDKAIKASAWIEEGS